MGAGMADETVIIILLSSAGNTPEGFLLTPTADWLLTFPAGYPFRSARLP